MPEKHKVHRRSVYLSDYYNSQFTIEIETESEAKYPEVVGVGVERRGVEKR